MRRIALLSAAALVSGCGRVPLPDSVSPIDSRYPVRSDLMAVGDLGAPPKWYTAGYPPLRSVRLGPRSPDPEFVSLLGPKVTAKKPAILDPQADLTPAQRDVVGDLLESYFGSAAAPKVRIITGEDAKNLKLAEMFSKASELDAALAESASAGAALHLDDAALARGSAHYHRWCLQCHGPTGGGDAAHAVAMTAMPRDFRRGCFKFATCYPKGTPRNGELGKVRKDDLKRTIHNGLDGSMMPPFPQFSEQDLDDLAGYVMHLSIRGECEFGLISRTINLEKDPQETDPLEFTKEFGEQVLVHKLLYTLGNWKRAEDSPIPIPPENVPREADRLLSAVRGHKAFLGTCAGCHQDFGRTEQLKFDLWGTVVQPRNLMIGVYRGGRKGEDLYARIYCGIYPSTMPDSKAKAGAAKPGEPDGIWDVVHFLQMLADPRGRKLMQLYDPSIKFEPN
jgi:mono/diheme cytochrome c family protein